MRHFLAILLIVMFAVPSIAEDGKWVPLFNGKNLDGWTPKIRYQEFGKDPGKTFRVVDGKMVVNYDAKTYPEFKETFGHIFYKEKFSHYKIRVEYRFVGDQVTGGPGWAYRNSGIMLHGQDPKTMAKDQDFPVSIEVQLLGGDGKNDRTTSNLCTPGTNVVKDGKLFKPHCTSSKSKTYHGDQWVTAEVEVHGDKVIKHIIDGEVVLQYEQPQLDPRDEDAKKLIKDGNVLLKEGYISLQSESHPVEFRKVELMDLGAGKAVAFAGNWNAVSVLPDGAEMESVVKLSGDNKSLKGSFEGDGGEVEIEDITIVDGGLKLEFELDMNGTILDGVINAKSEGNDKLVGKWVVSGDDGNQVAEGDWSAKRETSEKKKSK